MVKEPAAKNHHRRENLRTLWIILFQFHGCGRSGVFPERVSSFPSVEFGDIPDEPNVVGIEFVKNFEFKMSFEDHYIHLGRPAQAPTLK